MAFAGREKLWSFLSTSRCVFGKDTPGLGVASSINVTCYPGWAAAVYFGAVGDFMEL